MLHFSDLIGKLN